MALSSPSLSTRVSPATHSNARIDSSATRLSCLRSIHPKFQLSCKKSESSSGSGLSQSSSIDLDLGPKSNSRIGTRRIRPDVPRAQVHSADRSGNDERPELGENVCLGIDIGGTSIKAALVDIRTGLFVGERHVIITPQPATPQLFADVIKQMCTHFKWNGKVGIGFPAVVRSGIVQTAANIDKSWIGVNAEALFRASAGSPVFVVNDADAAAYAEIEFGTGKSNPDEKKGVVMMCTFGTGIGTSIFVDGILVPNLELGHLELEGRECEAYAAGVRVEKDGLTWDEWSERVSWYLSYLERLFWPNLFVIGGGVSNAHEKWLHLVKLPHGTPLIVAELKNDAGIIGAAMAAYANLMVKDDDAATHVPNEQSLILID